MILFVVFGLFVISFANGLRNCEDCYALNECPEALNQSNNTEIITKLRAAMCSSGKGGFKICCSDFKNDNVDVIENHQNFHLLPEECGAKESDRIIGGQVASLYEFPWLVLLSSTSSNKDPEFRCGGTLINRRYVLTAAHCTTKQISIVRVGEYDLSKKRDCFGKRPERTCESRIQDIPVNHTIVHPNYKRRPVMINDIALLRLQELVDFSAKNAGAICLPVFDNLLESDESGKIGIIAGWRKPETRLESNVLLKDEVPIHSVDVCKKYYLRENRTNYLKPFQSILCAGEIDADSCMGESGGPLMLVADYNGTDKFVQFGVDSYFMGCSRRAPTVYTDVRKYMKWILDTINP